MWFKNQCFFFAPPLFAKLFLKLGFDFADNLLPEFSLGENFDDLGGNLPDLGRNLPDLG